jgi:hypothetical protein
MESRRPPFRRKRDTLRGLRPEESDPWHPPVLRWALLSLQGRVLDTQIGDPFMFLESRTPLVVGRALKRSEDEDCDLRIRGDDRISRRHCELRYDRGSWWIRDLGSQNGTFVNGRRLDSTGRRLADMDQIRLGGTSLLFQLPDGSAGSVIRTFCISSDTGLPGPKVLRQLISRAVRREAPVHLALMGLPRGYDSPFHDELRALADGFRAAAEETGGFPPNVCLSEVSASPARLGVLFRGTAYDEVQFYCQRWHAALVGKAELRCANLVLTCVDSPYDEPIGTASEQLIGCELAGSGTLDLSCVSVRWCRSQEQLFLDDVARRRLPRVAVVGPPGRAQPDDASSERLRRGLARAVRRLPVGTRVSVAWRERTSLWFLASDASPQDFEEVLATFRDRRVVSQEPNDPRGWLTRVARELEFDRRVDPGVLSSPLIPMLSLDGLNQVERLVRLSARLESALRLLAAVEVARVGVELEGNGRPDSLAARSIDSALEAVLEARRGGRGIGTFVHLLKELERVQGERQSGNSALTGLARSGWFERALAATHVRNRRIHDDMQSGVHDPVRIERTLRELVEHLRYPSFQLLSVLDVQARRGGVFRVHLQRLVGPVMGAPELVERGNWADDGTWLELADGEWLRLHPWVVARVCPECGVHDAFVLDPLTVQPDRKLVLRGTHHAHEHQLEEQDPDRLLEFDTLMKRLGALDSRMVTNPGV